jgi:hypothetical protein
MRLTTLALAALLAASPAWAQETQPSVPADKTPTSQDTKTKSGEKPDLNLPVSLDKIKEALQQPPAALSLRSLDERPMFRVEILERQRIEELIASLFLKKSPGPFGGYAPGGGLYGYEQQRQMFPAVDNPLRQPYAAFNQGELLTILIENLVGKYLGGKAIDAVSSAERARAEAAAKEEVRSAISQYCAAQPNGGAGVQICGTTVR